MLGMRNRIYILFLATLHDPFSLSAGTKNAARTFDDTPLMQKVLRRGTFDATPNSPSPATPVKSLDLSSSYEGTDSKENLPAYQEEKVASENSRSALTSKNK